MKRYREAVWLAAILVFIALLSALNRPTASAPTPTTTRPPSTAVSAVPDPSPYPAAPRRTLSFAQYAHNGLTLFQEIRRETLVLRFYGAEYWLNVWGNLNPRATGGFAVQGDLLMLHRRGTSPIEYRIIDEPGRFILEWRAGTLDGFNIQNTRLVGVKP